MLEITLVSTVFMVCFGAALIPLAKVTNETKAPQFFQQMEADLFEAQSYAIVNNISVIVYFYYENKNKYAVFTYEHPRQILAERDMPAYFNPVDQGIADIIFYKTGTTNRIGTVYFDSGEKRTKLVFLLGRGRFYFEDE